MITLKLMRWFKNKNNKESILSINKNVFLASCLYYKYIKFTLVVCV